MTTAITEIVLPGLVEPSGCGHFPSRCSLAPFARPAHPLPEQPQGGPDTADVWNHRTSWRRAFDTRPRWCRVWRRRRPFGVLCVPGASRSRRGWRVQDLLNRNLDGSFARRIRFSAARYSFCSKSSWFTEPVTYASNRTHFLFLIPTAYPTLVTRSFGFLTIRPSLSIGCSGRWITARPRVNGTSAHLKIGRGFKSSRVDCQLNKQASQID